VLLLTGGASAAGLRAAQSHTGALVSESAAVDAACRAAGIVRVASPRELVERVQMLLARSRPRGRRLAVVSDGGGSAVIAADLAAGLGLELPQLSDELRRRLAAAMPATASTANPVDFAGAGEQDLRSYERIPRLLLESDEVDSVLLSGYIGGYGVTSDTLREPETDAARGLARAAAETGRTVVVQTMYWQEPPARALRDGGVPVYRDVEASLSSLACAVRAGERPPAGVPGLPGAAPPLEQAGYLEARGLLAAGGVPLAEAVRVETEEQALGAAAELGYPVVLKALGLVHKSDAGGVEVGLEDGAALSAAFAAMDARLAAAAYAVERMVDAPAAVELIAGCRVDPRFGPILLVGLGGILAEVLRDTAVALAPATAGEVEGLLRGLRGAALLTGVRGRPPLALGAAAEAAAALSRVAAAHPELSELEVNPLLVTPDAALALDARAVYL